MSKRPAEGLMGEALRFGLVGLANTGVGLSAIVALQTLTPAGAFLANAGGYAMGLCLSFLLNRGWTFNARDGAVGGQALRFLATFAACYCLNLAVLAGAIAAGMNPVLAQLPAILAYSAAFYLLSRSWVFRRRGPSPRTR